MRDNISIIFAAIFAVILLIVFPMFSLLTRQDNIAYNKVLTITTEFVDTVRTKGYFTEKEYTNYLVELAATQNTYKVDMECHKKMLIKDINKYTEENPVWIEDTAIYYNSYVEKELSGLGTLAFEEGDEFYVKVYNTNITTASLMYNYFLGSRVPRKIINIGYGGKILDSTGDTFAKVDFNSSYTPYVTLGEVVNEAGDDFKEYYIEVAIMENYYIKRINIDDPANKPIKVDFKLCNFSRIGGMSVNFITLKNEQDTENSENEEENITDKIIEEIKKYTVLRGNYIKSYDVDVEDLKYVAGNVEGTLVINNIKLQAGVHRTTAYIAIKPNLGSAANGVLSSEGVTEELTLTRQDYSPNVLGPYLEQSTAGEVITSSLHNKDTVYYSVTLKESNEIKRLELYDVRNSKIVATYENIDSTKVLQSEDYTVSVQKLNQSEYWIGVTPNYEYDVNNILESVKLELQLIVSADVDASLNINKENEVTTSSLVATWNILGIKVNCNGMNAVSDKSNSGLTRSVELYFDDIDRDAVEKVGAKEFFQKLANDKVIYLSKSKDTNAEKYGITIKSATRWDGYYQLTYDFNLYGGPEQTSVYFNFDNGNGNVISAKVAEWFNVPNGLYACTATNGLKVISNNVSCIDGSANYYWIPATTSEIADYAGDYYNDFVTKFKISDSIKRFGGFYIQKYSKSNTNDFITAWNRVTNLRDNTNLRTQFFASLPYKWQIDKISGLRVYPDKIATGDELWMSNDKEHIRFETGKYSAIGNDSISKTPYYFHVLYIK